jgi:hypothetical protein
MRLSRLASLCLGYTTAVCGYCCCGGRTAFDSAGVAGNANVVTSPDAAADAGVTIKSLCSTGVLQGPHCDSLIIQNLVRPPPSILIVFDASASMNDRASTIDNQTKWEEARDALGSFLQYVTIREPNDYCGFGADSGFDFGLELFPLGSSEAVNPSNNPSAYCAMPTGQKAVQVDITFGSNNVSNILTVLDNVVPMGGTPMSAALDQAYAYFAAGRGKEIRGTKWVLLVTDGGANCNADRGCSSELCLPDSESGCSSFGVDCSDVTLAVSAITRLADANIGTIVVGVPHSDLNAGWLDQLADAGQWQDFNETDGHRYFHISPSNELPNLQEAFLTTAGVGHSYCEIPLSKIPPDPAMTTVATDCTTIPRASSDQWDAGANPSSWTIDYTKNPPALIILGDACYEMMAKDNCPHEVDVVWGCP